MALRAREETLTRAVVGDRQVPLGEVRGGVCRDEEETGVETVLDRLARVGRGGLGNGVVAGGALEHEGDDRAVRCGDICRNILEDTARRGLLSTDLDLREPTVSMFVQGSAYTGTHPNVLLSYSQRGRGENGSDSGDGAHFRQ